MSDEKEEKTTKSALQQPIYWLIALGVVVAIKWDEIGVWLS
jgi:hypothetical protein